MLPQDFENAYEIHYMFGHQLALHNHVINIDFDVLPNRGSNILVIIR